MKNKIIIITLIISLLLLTFSIHAEDKSYETMSAYELQQEIINLTNQQVDISTTDKAWSSFIINTGVRDFISGSYGDIFKFIRDDAKLNINDYIDTTYELTYYGLQSYATDYISLEKGIGSKVGDALIDAGYTSSWSYNNFFKNNYRNTYSQLVKLNDMMRSFSGSLSYNEEVIITYNIITQNGQTNVISYATLDRTNFSDVILPLEEYITAEFNAYKEAYQIINQELQAKIDYLQELLNNRASTKQLTLNIEWLAATPEDISIDIYLYNIIQEYTNEDIRYVYFTNENAGSLIKTINIPAGQTEITVDLPVYDGYDTLYLLELKDLPNQYASDVLDNLDMSIDARVSASVIFNSSTNNVTKNIKIYNKLRNITFTNYSDKEYTEYILSIPHVAFSAKNLFNMAPIMNHDVNPNLVTNKYKSFILTDEDEPLTAEYFIKTLRYLLQLTVLYHNELIDILANNLGTIGKLNKHEYIVLFNILTDYGENKIIDTQITVNKKDINNKLLAGAEFEIYKDSQLITTWNEATKELSLSPGIYTIKEKTPPIGYDKIEDFTIEIKHTDNTLIDQVNKNTNNFFLTDEGKENSIKEIMTYLVENYSYDINTLYNMIISNIQGLTVNDINLYRILATNFMYVNDTFMNKHYPDKDAGQMIKETYEEYLEYIGMEELIPYLDYSESIFPIIKLRPNETITLNDVYTTTGELTVWLYGKNYDGYSITNRSTHLNNPFDSGNYSTTYTYTGNYKNKNVPISVSSESVKLNDNTLDIIDAKLWPVIVKKVDTNGDYLTDAKLQLLRDNEIINEWLSVRADMCFDLQAGKYVIREVEAPNGYSKASDIMFEITDDGKILINQVEVNNIEVINERIIQYGYVKIRKVCAVYYRNHKGELPPLPRN